MNSRHKLEALLLACALAISRYVFRSHDLYDLDSVNFALALQRFDPRVHQPHPPGYFLYVLLGRGLNLIFHDANLALVALSIAAGCGSIALIYSLSLEWFSLRGARFASLLFLFSPLSCFYGTVALTYSVEAFLSVLMGYLCWLLECGSTTLIAPTAVVLGLSAGIRPSSLVFLGPLYLLSLRRAPMSKKIPGVAALGLTLAAWIMPMIAASGGFASYFGALISLWRTVPARDTVFNSSPATSLARAFTISFIYLLTFGAASFAVFGAGRVASPIDPRKRNFTLIWIAPALCFFTFIFLKFVNSGYLLLLVAPVSIWLGYWASGWYERSLWRRPAKLMLIGLCAAANILIFLESPLYCSYRSVRKFEAQLEDIRTKLPTMGAPNDTLIIGFDSHFLGYRHAGYYLPSYQTIEYPEVHLQEGVRIFAMDHRNTQLFTDLPRSTYTRFLFFPLPGEDAAYADYLETVKKSLPEHSLHSVRIDGEDYVSGPIALLPLLFPQTAGLRQPGVYPPLHSGGRAVNTSEHRPTD